MKRAGDFLEKKLPHIQTTFAMTITSYALALIRSPRANDHLDSFASKGGCGSLFNQLCVHHSHGGRVREIARSQIQQGVIHHLLSTYCVPTLELRP